MRRFELDELPKEPIVLRVADLRLVEDVVAVVGLFDLLAQLFRAICDFRAQRTGATRSRNSFLRTLPWALRGNVSKKTRLGFL